MCLAHETFDCDHTDYIDEEWRNLIGCKCKQVRRYDTFNGNCRGCHLEHLRKGFKYCHKLQELAMYFPGQKDRFLLLDWNGTTAELMKKVERWLNMPSDDDRTRRNCRTPSILECEIFLRTTMAETVEFLCKYDYNNKFPDGIIQLSREFLVALN